MLAKQMNSNRSPLKDVIYLDSAGTPLRIFHIDKWILQSSKHGHQLGRVCLLAYLG
jgi:hypothetical protein